MFNQIMNFCGTCCASDAAARGRDQDLSCTKISLFVSAIFAILTIVFLLMMLNPERPVKRYSSLFFASCAGIFIPQCIRHSTCFVRPQAPPAPKKDAKA